jgi:hypothetical protein
LRFTRRFPTGCGKRVQHRIEIVYCKRNVDVSDIAGSKIDMFSVGWGEVLKQFNLVTVAFENGERNFGARHAGDFTGEITGMMCPMRKLESKGIIGDYVALIDPHVVDRGMLAFVAACEMDS